MNVTQNIIIYRSNTGSQINAEIPCLYLQHIACAAFLISPYEISC